MIFATSAIKRLKLKTHVHTFDLKYNQNMFQKCAKTFKT